MAVRRLGKLDDLGLSARLILTQRLPGQMKGFVEGVEPHDALDAQPIPNLLADMHQPVVVDCERGRLGNENDGLKRDRQSAAPTAHATPERNNSASSNVDKGLTRGTGADSWLTTSVPRKGGGPRTVARHFKGVLI